MKKIRIILIILLGVGLATYLIMFVTPWLYNHHPYNISHLDKSIQVSSGKESDIDSPVGEQPTIGDLGTFGDSAGFWNAIFSGLAILGVVYTLFYQFGKDKNDDERARLEQFHNQCIAMIGMLSEIVTQLKITDGRINEQPFVSNEISNSGWSESSEPRIGGGISQQFTQPEYTVTGRSCFKYIYDERSQQRNLKDFIMTRPYVTDSYIPDEDFYSSLRKVTENHFDHYFRTLYRILRFIESCDLGGIDEKKEQDARNLCSALLRAQLSTYEIAIIYYNSLYVKFRKTSKALYERICLFDNLDPKLLILKSERDYYSTIQQQKRNLSNYDCTIHYDCSAFVKQTVLNNTPNLLSRLKLLFKRKTVFSLNSDVFLNLSDIEWKVYRTIKGIGERPIEDRDLARKAEVSVNDLRQCINNLEGKNLLLIFHRDVQKLYRINKTI